MVLLFGIVLGSLMGERFFEFLSEYSQMKHAENMRTLDLQFQVVTKKDEE